MEKKIKLILNADYLLFENIKEYDIELISNMLYGLHYIKDKFYKSKSKMSLNGSDNAKFQLSTQSLYEMIQYGIDKTFNFNDCIFAYLLAKKFTESNEVNLVSLAWSYERYLILARSKETHEKICKDKNQEKILECLSDKKLFINYVSNNLKIKINENDANFIMTFIDKIQFTSNSNENYDYDKGQHFLLIQTGFEKLFSKNERTLTKEEKIEQYKEIYKKIEIW